MDLVSVGRSDLGNIDPRTWYLGIDEGKANTKSLGLIKFRDGLRDRVTHP